jgi:phage baseplate assembly protein V
MMNLSDVYRLVSRLEQRVSNLIRNGVVSEVQMDPPRVKVEYTKDADGNSVTTGWLCYFEERQGYVQHWNPPKVGEQCLILSAAGDLCLGKVLLGLNTTDNAAISTEENIHKMQFADGATFSYDRSTSTWDIDLGEGLTNFTGKTYTFNANLVINGDITQTGAFTTSGALSAESVAATNAITGSSLTVTGAVTGASLTVTGAVTAVSGVFSGVVTAVSGVFSGVVSASNI